MADAAAAVAAGAVPRVAAVDAPAGRRRVLPDIPVAPRVVRRAARIREQRMRGGAVVHHVVDDHADAAGVGLAQQFVEVGERAVFGGDGAVVGDGVAVVAVLARVDRHQPQARDAEFLQVIEPRGQPLQVTDAVAVAVLVGADEDFHEDAALPVRGQRAAGVGRGDGADAGGINGRRGCGGRVAPTTAAAASQQREGQRQQRGTGAVPFTSKHRRHTRQTIVARA